MTTKPPLPPKILTLLIFITLIFTACTPPTTTFIEDFVSDYWSNPEIVNVLQHNPETYQVTFVAIVTTDQSKMVVIAQIKLNQSTTPTILDSIPFQEDQQLYELNFDQKLVEVVFENDYNATVVEDK